ncbi:cyclic nucleotide-binding domain-containing protein [Pedobacter ginsengiterrae]|uniref:Cyclic nucleotide-binding domain-containing protein n=1 Tax=Pedobacter ginsengiterrae TaxID=871696 RepID=A0ABP7P3M7_9SPHI
MITYLVDHISKYVPLIPDEIKFLEQHLVFRKVGKKKKIYHPTDTFSENYFVIEGCLRLYSKDEECKERTIQFAIENWWMFDPRSISLNGTPNFYIDAIEETTLIVISRDSWNLLGSRIPALEHYFRIIFHRAYNASLWRINHIFCYQGSERYYHFTKLFPSFVQRIPQYMLASYLGLTPEFISMIRAKKS